MKKIFLCSPYKGDIYNRHLVEQACAYVASRGDIPIAPHAYFTHFLRDDDPEQRELGLKLGIHLLGLCSEMWVIGQELTPGMKVEIEYASKQPLPRIEFKTWKDVGVEHYSERGDL